MHNPEALRPVLNIPDGQSNLLNTCGPEDFAAEFCLMTATKDDYILIVNGAAGQTVMWNVVQNPHHVAIASLHVVNLQPKPAIVAIE